MGCSDVRCVMSVGEIFWCLKWGRAKDKEQKKREARICVFAKIFR